MRGGVLSFFSYLSLVGVISAASVLGAAAGACSSNESAPAVSFDAALGPGQALGTPCDPSIADPCETLTDVCSVSECDPTSRRCVRVPVEAGPTCGSGVAPSCASDDCDAGDAAADATTLDAGDARAADGSNDSPSGEDGGDAAVDAPSDTGGADADAKED